jgi:hypothetical protein
MSTWQLILFRLGLMVLGRVPGGSRLVRRMLLAMVRRGGRMTYVAHGGFLDVREMNRDGSAEPLLDRER